jgi:RNA polymerase sigma-70 factor, ECF subfamily
MDDPQILLQEISRMDRQALAQVYDLYAPAIYKYACRHLGNARLADQVVGEVFARLLEQCARGRGPRANLRAYLSESAYHAIVDELRQARRLQPLEAAGPAVSTMGDPARTQEDQALLEAVRQAMHDELSGDQRHVLLLRFQEDFSLQETARILGRNVGSVKVLQGRALSVLRRAPGCRASGSRPAFRRSPSKRRPGCVGDLQAICNAPPVETGAFLRMIDIRWISSDPHDSTVPHLSDPACRPLPQRTACLFVLAGALARSYGTP